MKDGDPRDRIKRFLREERLEDLLVEVAAMHGHYCPGLAFGIRAGYEGVRRLGFDNTGMEELLAVVECNNCFVDGIQVSTGCSFGNNALIYKDIGKTAVTVMSRKTMSAVRLRLKNRGWDEDDATDKEKEAGELFRRLVKERQEDEDASVRMKELFREISFETVNKPELFEITDVPAVFPEYAPIVDSSVCDSCGEEFMETKKTLRDERILCLQCAGEDCLSVLGRGICVLEGCSMRPGDCSC